MEIELPEPNPSTGELKMFCREDRMTRELYWVGFGFQIWCQLLTHIARSKHASLIVMDEPETYLHPDLQRQLLGIVRQVGADVLLATHSSEIMSESDPSEIVLIDKNKRTGERLKDVIDVQKALDAVGSSQNITLTALARSRRVLFVEGDDDFRLLRRFARRRGLQELAAGSGVISLASGGFGSWQRITILASGIAQALGSSLSIAAIYDRDYFCEEQISEVTTKLSEHLSLAHVHGRKEIENYLLIPSVLDRALRKACDERLSRSGIRTSKIASVESYLVKITDPMHDEVLSQITTKRGSHMKSTGRDLAEIYRETFSHFEDMWKDLERRLTIVPGKEVLSKLRNLIQSDYGVSLTDARIIDAMHRDEIPFDLQILLSKLDEFRESAPLS
jgi:predicted ATP-dependent endonuclease of OLD family